MLVPIWASTRELECCVPEAEVGTEWKVPVAFRPELDPWWVRSYGASATDEQRRLGVVRLHAATVEADEEVGQQLMRAGPITFRAGTDVRAGAIEGRFHLDAHAETERFRGRNEVGGVVERVQLVRLRFVKKTERTYAPAEQMDAVDAPATAARSELIRWRGDELMEVEPLVWLRVE